MSRCFPGDGCQAVVGSEAADFNNSGAIVNASAQTEAVVCPIVRDNHTNLNGVKGVGVRVRSPNATKLTCVLASLTALGGLVEDVKTSHRH